MFPVNRQAVFPITDKPQSPQIIDDKVLGMILGAEVQIIMFGVVEVDFGHQSSQKVCFPIILAWEGHNDEGLERLQSEGYSDQLPIGVQLDVQRLKWVVVSCQLEAASQDEMLPLD